MHQLNKYDITKTMMTLLEVDQFQGFPIYYFFFFSGFV